MFKFNIFFLIFVFALSCNTNSAYAQSQWVSIAPDGKLIYKTTPKGDRIMDFSSAGYMGGGVAFPNVPVKKTVRPLGGNADDVAAIQAAIDDVAAMPLENGFRGAVLLEPGAITVCEQSEFPSAALCFAEAAAKAETHPSS